MLELLVLILSNIVNAVLGLSVYLKNPKSITNKLFLLLTTSFILWSTVNYISLHPFGLPQLWWVRLVLFFAAMLCLSVFLTFDAFPHFTLKKTYKSTKIAVYSTLIIMALTLTPLVFKKLTIENGNAQPVPNPGIALFALLVISLLGGGIYTLIKKYRISTGKQRAQIRFVLLGLSGAFGLIVITNFLLVVIFHNSSFVILGPAYTLIFSGSMAYAIVRHRLFDIRAAVSRALAYVLSLGFIVLLYGLLAYSISIFIVKDNFIDNRQRIIYIVFALITALIYPNIKKYFDHLTNRFFFKDIYDPQLFLDQLNDSLIKNIQLDNLLSETSLLISSTFKSSFVKFLLPGDGQKRQARFIGTSKKFSDDQLLRLTHVLHEARKKTIITDELVDTSNIHVHQVLSDFNISVVESIATNNQKIGYLIIGNRQSGEAFRDQDLQLIAIITNEISIAIQNALRFEEIEQFNITLQEKIDNATRELRRTNEKLRQLDEAKDEFISMASHQLRTPLTSVKGYVSMVLEGDAGGLKSQQRKLLDQAFVSSQRMVYLIADLLNVSRLKTGKFVIEPTPTYLPDVVEGEISQLTETAKGRNLALTFDKPKSFSTLMLDETKTRQVIMNFADNAIYYTPSGGHIKVNLTETDDSVEFTVVDDGLGVPKQEQHHLFSKFYRAGNAKKARPDGTGLGLFMAKKVVVAQGGAIIFKSTEGQGSTFGFSFPKKKLLAPASHKPKTP